jgi:drug/metabolite transporter (DMT)-like permease
MIGASLSFAGMAAFIKLAANDNVPITHILFFRGFVSVVLAVAFLRLRRIPIATPHFKAHVLRGCAGFAAMLTYIAAIAHLPLATAVTLNYTSPLLLAVMLLVVHRERPHPILLAALVSGLGGIVLMSRPIYDQSQWLGGVLGLLSALLAAVSALNIRMLGRLAEPPARTVLYFSMFIACAALPLYLMNHPRDITGLGVLYSCSAAALATIGQWMLTVAYQQGHTLLMSLLGYSQVVFSSILGVWLWNDVVPLVSWLGIAMIVGSGAGAVFSVRTSTPKGRALT